MFFFFSFLIPSLSDANNTPGSSIGGVSDVDDVEIDFSFVTGDIPDLSCNDAVLGQDGVVFGPVVSPTLEFPADCDGVPCEPICGIPGGELGGLVASSPVFECEPPNFAGCPAMLSIEVIGEVLVKEVGEFSLSCWWWIGGGSGCILLLLLLALPLLLLLLLPLFVPIP